MDQNQNPGGSPDPSVNPAPGEAQSPFGTPPAYGAQPPYAPQPPFAAPPAYGAQPQFGAQAPYGPQPPYAPPPPYGTPPAYGPQPPYAPPPFGVPVAPVAPVKLGRSGRFRWAIALGIVLVVAMVTAAGAFVLSGAGGSAKSLTAGNAPKTTVMFVDVRTDLPGDQHQKLADFMSHFPGFKDRAQFDSAFDEMLNRITSSISPDLNYTSAFKGWATGELSVAVTSLGGPNMSTEGGVLIVALKDRAAGEAWVNSEIARTGATFTSQDYAGTKLNVSKTATNDLPGAYAFTDKVLIAGDEASVKAALDAPAKGSLAESKAYLAAMGSFSGDSVATFYVDTTTLMNQMMSSMTSGLFGVSGMGLSSTSYPAWVAGSVRADSDHMTVEMRMAKTTSASGASNAGSVVANDLPASTVGVYEIHSIGKTLNAELKAMGSNTSTADSVKQIQDALAMIGGIDWIGDTDVVVTKDGSSFGGGLVVRTPDSATATAKKIMLTNLISLAGGSYGLTSTEETYNGTTITLVSVPTSGIGGAPGTSTAPVRIGIATKGSLIVAGYDDAFVKAVLDTTASNSLASQSDFKTVMAAVGSSNMEYGYFNVAAVANEIGQSFSGNAAYYNLNYKPYVDHIGGAAFAAVDGDTVTLRIVVTAK
jgi:hypothetical protein